MVKQTTEFAFRKQDSIGANDAEDDKKFLLNCFIDTGDYDLVEDLTDTRCLILGRTGMGKTALLTKLKDQKKEKRTVITVDPEALAMQHISNSPVIKQIFNLDIDLNTFFKLLWRHALCVEIFTHHFNISSESESNDLIEKLKYTFRHKNTKHLRALNYLEEWKDTFWKQDNSHVVEMLKRTESELGGTLGASVFGASSSISGKNTVTEEEKKILKQQAQAIVDEVQMKEVTHLIEMLNEVVEDQQKKYYIIIDKLDEGWVDNQLRYRLIKSLIETVRDLNRFDNLKPLVVLRADLLGHVFEVTLDHGFQEEKYKSLYLHVGWTKKELAALLDERLHYLLKSRYRKNHKVVLTDILPEKIDNIPAIDYILDRTLMRPRDAISFINHCIREAVDSPEIKEEMVTTAERVYSRDRLESIFYEWQLEYPNLKEWIHLLRNRVDGFFAGSLELESLRDQALKYCIDNHGVFSDRIQGLCSDLTEDKISLQEFRNYLLHIFYTTGLVGIQIGGDKGPIWSHDLQKNIAPADLDERSIVHIHPCFKSALNTGITIP